MCENTQETRFPFCQLANSFYNSSQIFDRIILDKCSKYKLFPPQTHTDKVFLVILFELICTCLLEKKR